ncbi:pilus assembly protein TadG-related protein [Pelotomaculum isophthalicicum JI]|uniref:Pilus assembly protein TadG-related protein n=1 Tax=Pelotomaculum isophthalicicum JI TaxID=947010 RepID=A0A9X4JV81_9FIRM|nr:TadE/TadG family type IV pilus assembly protein [Pelotomaculum isophthalicicum]MDF9406927.1 pilus assembly protein TadG-related protein [Pelotomaculum isophthalicicum JI]
MKIRIIKFLRDLVCDQKGFAMVIITAGMVGLLGFTALVTDIGMLLLNKQKLSNAVDAAVLAGAQELPVNPVQAINTAENYVLTNGYIPDQPTVSAYNGRQDTQITVSATKQVNYFFARVLGLYSGIVSAQASARVAGLSSYKGAAPLAIPNQTFDFNTRYTLKQGSNSPEPSPLGPGTYGALSLGGTGASNYEDNLKYGYDGKLTVGEEIDTETGNMSNPTKRAIDYRMDLCNHSPACTPSNFDPGCPRILIVPVYEPIVIDHGQVAKIRIIGFAAFLVDRVTAQGNENYIEGYFIKMVVEGDSSSSQADYGIQGAKLIE